MKIIETDMDLLQWVADSGPGDRCEYYRGHLAQARFDRQKRVIAVANTALDLEKERLVHLVQVREGEEFSYQAVSRAKPPLFAKGDK